MERTEEARALDWTQRLGPQSPTGLRAGTSDKAEKNRIFVVNKVFIFEFSARGLFMN